MKLKDLRADDLFYAKQDSNVMYRYIGSFTETKNNKVKTYYLAARAYSIGKTGFYLTDGEKEVFK